MLIPLLYVGGTGFKLYSVNGKFEFEILLFIY
jgi:hypothetical protein